MAKPKRPAARKLRGLPATKRSDLVRFLAMGMDKSNIAAVLKTSERTVYRYARKLMMFGHVAEEAPRRLGRPSKLTQADGDALLDYMLGNGWLYLDEMKAWLEHERGAMISNMAIHRLIKKRGWSRAALKRVAVQQNNERRAAWREDMRNYVAEDLLFLDESIFNEKTGWRYRAYGPIGEERRYPADIRRGPTCSIIAAISTNGYMPCVGVREGYWSTADVIHWLQMSLLPALEIETPGKRWVLVFDNCSVHLDPAVKEVITASGHEIKFLPPYSPDLNPIEMTFSVLKSWMRRHYPYTRHLYDSFVDYLAFAVRESRCDRFARKHFKHSANGLYLEQAERDRFLDWVQRGKDDPPLLVTDIE